MSEGITCLTHQALGDEYAGLRTGISYDSRFPNIRLLTVLRNRPLTVDREKMLVITSARQTFDPHVFIERTINCDDGIDKPRLQHCNFGGGSKLEVFSDGAQDCPHYHLTMAAQIRDITRGGFWHDLSVADEAVREVAGDIMVGLRPACQVVAEKGVAFSMGNRPVLFFDDEFYSINEEVTGCHSYDTQGQWVREGEYHPYRSYFAPGGIRGYVEVLAGDMYLNAARSDHWPMSSAVHIYRLICKFDLLYTTFSDINQVITSMIANGQRDDYSLRSLVNPHLIITRLDTVT